MLSCNKFFPSHIVAFTSDYSVDFTLQHGFNSLTLPQREFLTKQLGSVPSNIINIRQVHGNKVLVIKDDYYLKNRIVKNADGLITNVSNLPLVIRTADCLPVFIYDTKVECIGLVHAGWRGSLERILPNALKIMALEMHSRMRDIRIFFGPAIRACCYRVGKEFVRYFSDSVIEKNGGYYFDLADANKKQLFDLGVKEENVFDCGICTCCDNRYFSFRREGKLAGRMISLMMFNYLC